MIVRWESICFVFHLIFASYCETRPLDTDKKSRRSVFRRSTHTSSVPGSSPWCFANFWCALQKEGEREGKKAYNFMRIWVIAVFYLCTFALNLASWSVVGTRTVRGMVPWSWFSSLSDGWAVNMRITSRDFGMLIVMDIIIQSTVSLNCNHYCYCNVYD